MIEIINVNDERQTIIFDETDKGIKFLQSAVDAGCDMFNAAVHLNGKRVIYSDLGLDVDLGDQSGPDFWDWAPSHMPIV